MNIFRPVPCKSFMWGL